MVFAVAAVVAAAAAAAVGAVRYFILDEGFIGLPPEGAVASTPERGELVLRYFGPDPGHHGKSRVWVYADGRVISLRGTSLPEGANAASTGFLEQRLTRDGVEKLRSEVAASTGVGQPPSGSAPLTFHTIIEVREGARLVRVEWSSDQAWLEARLSDPASSLPAAAWQERVARAYVPSRFAVCYGGPWDRAVEPSRILSLLPAQARDLLHANAIPSDRLFMQPGDVHIGPVSLSTTLCSDVTLEEARALGAALDDAGLEPVTPKLRLAYVLEVPGPNGGTAQISFEPYLPDGQVTCSICG